MHMSELSWLHGGLWPVAAAGRSQADVALCSVAVSVLSSLVWNLEEWLVLPVLLESPQVTVGSGQAPGWAEAWLLIPAL